LQLPSKNGNSLYYFHLVLITEKTSAFISQ
jgi:hypothetical protein